MKVGIIGSGDVGRILGNGFAAKGHDVLVGTRDPQGPKAKELQGKLQKAKVGTFADAAKHGEVLVLCVHGTAAAQAVEQAGPQNLAGKLVLDTTNPLEFGPKGAHKPAAVKSSLLEDVQKKAPQAKFVKAWNCTPGPQMVDPKFKEGAGDQVICGDDAKAKEQAARILKEFGWNAVDIGDASMGPYVEGMAIAVINYGAKTNDWGWGVKLVGRKS